MPRPSNKLKGGVGGRLKEVLEKAGFVEYAQLRRLSKEAGLGAETMPHWFYGNIKEPIAASLGAVVVVAKLKPSEVYYILTGKRAA